MDLNDFLGPKPIVIDLHAENRWEAIDELIDQLVVHHKIKAEHRNAIAESVRKRETSMSTGIGMGIGIPHASTDLVGEVVGAIGRSRKGVQFDALDGKGSATVPVASSGVPPDESVREDAFGEDAERGGRDARAPQFQKHLHPLANLARLPHNLEKG